MFLHPMFPSVPAHRQRTEKRSKKMLEFILTPSEKCHHWVSGGHDNCRNQLPFRFTNSASTGSIRSFRDSKEEEKKKSWAENDSAGKLFRSQTDYPHESKIHIHLSSKYIQDKSKYPDFKANRKPKWIQE